MPFGYCCLSRATITAISPRVSRKKKKKEKFIRTKRMIIEVDPLIHLRHTQVETRSHYVSRSSLLELFQSSFLLTRRFSFPLVRPNREHSVAVSNRERERTIDSPRRNREREREREEWTVNQPSREDCARVMKSSRRPCLRESSLPSTAHAPTSTWLSAPRLESRAPNSTLCVFQGRG